MKVLCVATANGQLAALEWVEAEDRVQAQQRFLGMLNARQYPFIYQVYVGGEGGSEYTLDCNKPLGSQMGTLTSWG